MEGRLGGNKRKGRKVDQKVFTGMQRVYTEQWLWEWRKSRLERLEDSMDVIYDMNNERGE